MCLQPLRLLSNAKNFNPLLHRVFNTFPCGHCEECANSKQQEWLIRSYYEYQDIKLNGMMMFVTLTFNEYSIPKMNIYSADNDGEPRSLRCFDKHLVQKFRRQLRKNIYYYFLSKFLRPYETEASKERRKLQRANLAFGNIKIRKSYDITPEKRNELTKKAVDLSSQLRYIITSEYGGKTHRPHHHAILSLPYKLPDYVFKHLIRLSWPHGFSNFGKLGGVVTDTRALFYVTKYVTKDFDFQQTFVISDNDILEYDDCLDNDEVINRCSPFHFQSIGFGASVEKYVNPQLLNNGKCTYVHTKKGTVIAPLPTYLIHKLFYKTSPDGTRTLNDRGLTYKLNSYKQQERKYVETFSNLLKNFDTLPQDFYRSAGVSQTEIEYVKQVFNYRPLNHLAKYIIYYRDYANVPALPRTVYNRFVESDYISDYSNELVFINNDGQKVYDQKELSNYLFTDKLCFSDLERCYKIFSKLKSYKARCRIAKLKKQIEDNSKLKKYVPH